EPVDLIDDQNRARGVQGPPLLGPGDHLLEISDPRGDRVDLLDLRTGRLRDDVGERGLPRPWWAVQDERRKVIAFDGPAQQASRAYQVLLAHEFVQRPWPHSGRQRRLCRDLPGGALLKQLHGLLLAYREAKNTFTLPGLGKLVLVNRKARMGRNPQTGEPIRIPAKRVVRFRVAKAAKDAILGNTK